MRFAWKPRELFAAHFTREGKLPLRDKVTKRRKKEADDKGNIFSGILLPFLSLRQMGWSVPGTGYLYSKGDVRVFAACNSQTWRGVIQSSHNVIMLLTWPVALSLSLSLYLSIYLSIYILSCFYRISLFLFSVSPSLPFHLLSQLDHPWRPSNAEPAGWKAVVGYAGSYVALITGWRRSPASGCHYFFYPG